MTASLAHALTPVHSRAAIDVRVVRGNGELETFLRMPWTLGMKADPQWAAPILDDQRRLLNPAKSPFWKHGEVACFLAWEGRTPVGRISAQIDLDFDHTWPGEPGVAFFGFFDAPDRPEVARALFASAEAWARGRGRRILRGPFTLDSKGDVGVLVEGFDTPTRVGMPHNARYVDALVESAGYTKCKDFFAWWFVPGLADAATIDRRLGVDPGSPGARPPPGLRIRTMNTRRLQAEVDVIRDIYNDVWKRNWGFVPLTAAELHIIATEYKMFMDPELALVAELDGETAGMCFGIPDVNEMMRDLDGELKLKPLNLAKLLWRVRFDRPRTARLTLLGIKERFRKKDTYGRIAATLVAEWCRRAAKQGYTGAEFGWTLEDNVRVNRMAEAVGAKRYKTYRVYERRLTAPGEEPACE